jgi:hypothetical protein
MHIKTEYTCRFQLARAEYNTATDVERQEKGLKNPIAVTVRSKVSREFWHLESEQFHQEIGQLVEAQYVHDMEE